MREQKLCIQDVVQQMQAASPPRRHQNPQRFQMAPPYWRLDLHRALGGPEQKMNIGLLGTGALQQSLPLSSSWSLGGADEYGIQQASTWPLGGNHSSGLSYTGQANLLPLVQKGWRNGDWICNCGFHNYSSRAECKKCNASMPQALGTKRLASEELVHNWDNKRLNAGQALGLQHAYPAFDQVVVSGGNQTTGLYTPSPYASGSLATAPNLPVNLQFPYVAATPTLLGKGAKQWRDGDWMCTNCNNHNYASRSNCNRCKSQRDAPAQPLLTLYEAVTIISPQSELCS
ncbi:uncharacterized protein LOC131303227 isoform X2 [Rhododendron vialii]|uniref:uncharacterized protein LOC131303227 isoform X2 n=1 Tax=Rhododendron vialii TaxID=182163 RepID=UPI00265F5A40|nr:uncharacterized protein LOC131303227 isoform X2 [Rhododendron vialii]